MNPYARHKARKLAVQAIYQWQITQDPIDLVMAQYLADINHKKIDVEYFIEVVKGVAQSAAELDKNMEAFLDRKLGELSVVELAVLRLAIYELLNKLDVPYKVVIDEALELTKTYGSIEGFKYVNGILDKVAKILRHDEAGVTSVLPKIVKIKTAVKNKVPVVIKAQTKVKTKIKREVKNKFTKPKTKRV